MATQNSSIDEFIKQTNWFYVPKFKDTILLSYEGTDVGSIYLSDIGIEDDKCNLHGMVLNYGSFAVIDCTKQVNMSLQSGVIKYFSDIVKWTGKPPLATYRLRHFI